MNSVPDPEEVAMENAFFGLPDPKVRATMSPEKLAILLHECKEGTPAYILVEHELNIRIASVQSRATYVGIAAGITGIVLGVFLTAWLQKPPTINYICERQTEKGVQRPVDQPKPPTQPPIAERGKVIYEKPNDNKR